MQTSDVDILSALCFALRSSGNSLRKKFTCLRELFQMYILPRGAELYGSW